MKLPSCRVALSIIILYIGKQTQQIWLTSPESHRPGWNWNQSCLGPKSLFFTTLQKNISVGFTVNIIQWFFLLDFMLGVKSKLSQNIANSVFSLFFHFQAIITTSAKLHDMFYNFVPCFM